MDYKYKWLKALMTIFDKNVELMEKERTIRLLRNDADSGRALKLANLYAERVNERVEQTMFARDIKRMMGAE